jgi:hypothetical protein
LQFPDAREERMSRLRTIVHPTDFSRASTPAFKRAVEMAKDNRAQLLVVHVLAPSAAIVMADGYVSPKVYDDMDAAARAGAQKQLRRLAEQAKRSGVGVRPLLLEGIAHAYRAGGARPEGRPARNRHAWPDRLRPVLPGQRGQPSPHHRALSGSHGAREVERRGSCTRH